MLFTGWSPPFIDGGFLDAAPNLKAIFHAAGSVGAWMTESFWDRGIVVTSAAAANAIPTAEFSLAAIIFSLKSGWSLAGKTRQERTFPERNGAAGCYLSTIGLVSMGAVARTLRRLLLAFDLNVLVYDPFLTDAEAKTLDVERVSLDELFHRSDVVSVHTPALTETHGLDLADGHAIWVHYQPQDDERVRAYVQQYQHPVLAISERSGIVIDATGWHTVGYAPGYRFNGQVKHEV